MMELFTLLGLAGWALLLAGWVRIAPRLRPRTCRLVQPKIKAQP